MNETNHKGSIVGLFVSIGILFLLANIDKVIIPIVLLYIVEFLDHGLCAIKIMDNVDILFFSAQE